MEKNNIVLIGMPGCGKSTVGVLLAKRIRKKFVDTDLFIQEQEERLLCEIIEEDGLERFKEIENEFDDVVLIPININDDNDIIVAQYGIRSIPTLIFIKQGEQLHRISGYRTPDEMRKIINEINK